MKSIHTIAFLLYFLSLPTSGVSQNTMIDSLETRLKNHKENDTIRVNLLNELAHNYSSSDIVKAEEIAIEANNFSKKLKFTRGEAKSFYIYSRIHISKSELDEALDDGIEALKLYNEIGDYNGIASTFSVLGTISFYKNDADKALLYYNKALDMAEKNKNRKMQADVLNNIGNISYIKGDLETAIHIYKKAIAVYDILGDKKGAFYPMNNLAVIYNRQGKSIEALNYFNKCLTINREQKNIVNIAAISLNMATVYSDRQEYEKALDYYKESLRLNKELNNSREASKCLIGLGGIYEASNDYANALDHYSEALAINKEINSTEGLVTSYDNIGSLYLKMGQPKSALNNFKTCLSLSQSIENKRTICNSYISLSETYFVLKEYPKALNHALVGEKLADDLALLPKEKEVNIVLSKIYEATGEFEKSLKHFKIYKQLNDSLFNKENIENIAQIEYEYKYKQELDSANIRELNLAKVVLSTSQDLEKSKQNYLWAIIGFLLTSILLGFIIFYQKLRNIKAKNRQIVTEQKLLRSQMTPHFIFNSLSVLQGMILDKEDKKSVNYLSKFSKLLRITLENSRDKTVLLSQELEAIRNYLALRNLENELYEYTIIVDDAIDKSSIEIPPMLIQPFVENAIEHAFADQPEIKKIDIHLSYLNSNLTCTITDNGIGINSSKATKNHYKKSLATTITSERLKILSEDFKTRGTVIIEDRQKYSEQGTKVTLVIPHKRLTA